MSGPDEIPEGDEISPEALAQLNAILAQSLGEEATEEEVDALIAQVCAIPGGAALWESLQEQIAAGEGPLLDEVMGSAGSAQLGDLPDAELYQIPRSSYHLVYTIHAGSSQSWRRLSLPTDAGFFDLHYALQDAFGQVDPAPHHFEFRVGDWVEVALGQGEIPGLQSEVFCEFQNRPADFFQEGATQLFYLQPGAEIPSYRIALEKIIQPQGTSEVPLNHPQLIDGQEEGKALQREGIVFRIPSEFLNQGA